ncbi:MAG: hypothetical protein NT090_06430, partial [Acidobacteria bacterium]|nr:hypothetical protein [Acidobacteriota bacterium]
PHLAPAMRAKMECCEQLAQRRTWWDVSPNLSISQVAAPPAEIVAPREEMKTILTSDFWLLAST